MDELLLFLAENGAFDEPVHITTKALGPALSMSQQNASVRIRGLEAEKLIQKTEKGIQITKKGKLLLESFYFRLGSVLRQKKFIFTGKVVSGFEKGKYFLSLPGYKKEITRLLGFVPYPGTLNLEIDDSQIENRIALREHKPFRAKGFKYKNKNFGQVDLYPCTISGFEGAILFPYRSHHGLRILELISPHDLSKKLNLKDPIKVELVFE